MLFTFKDLTEAVRSAKLKRDQLHHDRIAISSAADGPSFYGMQSSDKEEVTDTGTGLTAMVSLGQVEGRIRDEKDKWDRDQQTAKQIDYLTQRLEEVATMHAAKNDKDRKNNAYTDGKTDRLCFFCNQAGHIQRNCPLRKVYLQQNKTNKQTDQQTSNQTNQTGFPQGFPSMMGYPTQMPAMWPQGPGPAASPFPWPTFWSTPAQSAPSNQIPNPWTTFWSTPAQSVPSTQTPNPHLKALN